MACANILSGKGMWFVFPTQRALTRFLSAAECEGQSCRGAEQEAASCTAPSGAAAQHQMALLLLLMAR